MKFTSTKDHLQQGLKYVSGIAGRNPTLPILRNVLLRSEKGKLQLSTTDLEVGVTVWVRGKVEQDGATTTPLRQLSEYVVNLLGDRVELSTRNGALAIHCGPSHATFQGESAENFPIIPPIQEGWRCSLSGSAVATALERVSYAAALDETRPELTGVLWVGGGDEKKTFTLAATDSYRLAEAHLPLPDPPAGGVRVILPLRAAQELRRLLDHEETVSLTFTDGQFLAETGSARLISRLIDGTYPDYTQIIPEKSPTAVSVLRADLLRALRGASIFSSRDTNAVRVETTARTIKISATAQEIGETTTEVPAEAHGERVTIHFNPRFLIEALQALPGERVRMELTNPSIPTLLRPEDPSQRVVALVMPIKT